MIDVQVFIPVADNEGQLFTSSHDNIFIDWLISQFGGCSVLSGLVAGSWKEEGQTYHDQNRVFCVFVRGMVQDADKLTATIERAKDHYRQLAITIRYLGMSEIL